MTSKKSKSEYVYVNDVKIYYEIHNDYRDTTILAIHGLTGSHHGLVGLVRELDNYRFVLMDLPGHGLSDHLPGEYSIDNLTKIINQFISQMNPAPKIILGHSFGTLLCINGAIIDPRKFPKLILCNPVDKNNYRVNSLVLRIIYSLVDNLPENLGRRLVFSKKLNHFIFARVLKTSSRKLRASLEENGYNEKTIVEYQTGLQLAREGRRFNTKQKISKLSQATLAIYGDADPMISSELISGLEANPNITVEMVEGGGHLVPLESPLKIARLISSWLTKQI